MSSLGAMRNEPTTKASLFAQYLANERKKPCNAERRSGAHKVHMFCQLARVSHKYIREQLDLDAVVMKEYMKLKKHEPPMYNELDVEARLVEFVDDYIEGIYDEHVRRIIGTKMRTSDDLEAFLFKYINKPSEDHVPKSSSKKRPFTNVDADGNPPSSHVAPRTDPRTYDAKKQPTATEWYGNGGGIRTASHAAPYEAERQCIVAEERGNQPSWLPYKRPNWQEEPAKWRLCVACDEPLANDKQYYEHISTVFHRAADKLHKAGAPMRTWSALRVDNDTGELHCVPSGRKLKTYAEWEVHRRSDEYWLTVVNADPRYKSKLCDQLLI